MRNKLLISFIIFVIGCAIQPVVVLAQDSCTSIKFSSVVQVDSISKAELYDRARLWFANTFNDSKKVLEILDKESGELVGKGAFNYHSRYFLSSGATAGWINFTIRIFLKEGRYMYEIGDFNHEANPGNQHPYSLGTVTQGYCPRPHTWGKGWQHDICDELRDLSIEHKRLIVASLKKAMVQPSVKSDW